jgi:hypothetical protein
MDLYLDDDSVDPLLIRLLRMAGHDVLIPAAIGLSGSPDPVHFQRAIRGGRALLSGNYADIEALHDLVIEAQGRHPGILIVRRDNNPKRDLSPRGIVSALANFLFAGVPVVDHYHVLNHWR